MKEAEGLVTRLKAEAGQRSKFANLHAPLTARARLPKTQVLKPNIHSAPSGPSSTSGGLSRVRRKVIDTGVGTT